MEQEGPQQHDLYQAWMRHTIVLDLELECADLVCTQDIHDSVEKLDPCCVEREVSDKNDVSLLCRADLQLFVSDHRRVKIGLQKSESQVRETSTE